MRHIMFDIDGTLIKSNDFDTACFVSAVEEVVRIKISSDWARYNHVTDAGILEEIFDSNGVGSKQANRERVKRAFIRNIQKCIRKSPVEEIPGASLFLGRLQSMDNVAISLATGGWYETAILKLNSAGIDFGGIPIASSNDHVSRVAIMRTAQHRTGSNTVLPCIYFGDGSWDKQACAELGFSFVLVGDQIQHEPRVQDYTSTQKIMDLIGLIR